VRRSWPDLPGVAVWPWPAGSELHVRIDDTAAHDPSSPVDAAAVEARWERLRRINPRHFDGPLLSVTRLEPGRHLVCRRSSYRFLAVQPEVETGVEQLSVTGVVLGHPEGGARCVLMGRRGRGTRIYGGMWELAPSGGLAAPPGRATLCEGDLVEQLRTEFREETGSNAALRGVSVRAVCQDLVARSYDVVFACRVNAAELTVGLVQRIECPSHWEYENLRWVPVARLREFDRDNAAEVIEPTRALFRFFGWA
jgi:hypothetical protein